MPAWQRTHSPAPRRRRIISRDIPAPSACAREKTPCRRSTTEWNPGPHLTGRLNHGAVTSPGRASDLHHDGQDHGAPAGAVPDVFAQGAPARLLYRAPVGDLLPPELGESLGHALRGLVEQVARLVDVHEPSADEVRARQHLGGVRVDGHDAEQKAVLGEKAPVPKYHGADVSHPEPVDEDGARLDGLGAPNPPPGELQDVAVGDDAYGRTVDAGARGDLGVQREMAILAVDRNEMAGAHERGELAELAGGGMPRDVHRAGLRVVDGSPRPVESVDDPVHGGLVSRYRARRQDHRVTRLGAHPLVLPGGYERERRQRLTL